MKKIFNTLIISALIITFTSCEKVIDLPLDNAEPVLVVSANISDQSGPYSVTLSKTIDYDQPNIFPTVSGAIVTIKDNNGADEILTETTPGTYSTSTLQGTPGNTYELTINEDGKTYTSSAMMPNPINIDTVYIGVFSAFGEPVPILNINFYDTPNEKNYYYLNYLINGEESGDYSLLSDQLRDGELIETGTISDAYEGVGLGDTITVQLQSIDFGMYEYLRTREELDSGGGFGASTPQNPTSNITGGCLGYFKVYSQTTRDLILQ